MSRNDPKSYAIRSTPELEALLRRPDVPPDHRRLIEDELTRRYGAELADLSGPSQPQIPWEPPRAGAPRQATSQPQPVQPSENNASQTAGSGSGKVPAKADVGGNVLKGCLLVLVLVIGLLVVLHFTNQSTKCTTFDGGYCTLTSAASPGSSCTCFDSTGYPHQGLVR